MRKVIGGLLVAMGIMMFLGVRMAPVWAQEASTSAETEMGSESAMMAEVQQMLDQQNAKQDLTKPEEVKSRLEAVLDSQQVGPLGITNPLKVAIRKAVAGGVPPNTIVLMILFPLVAAVIAAARHIVGLSGFGIFTPAVIAVAFLATGVTTGILIFGSILLVATVARMVLRRMKLPSMPRMSLLLWFVSMGILALVLGSPWIRLESLIKINIFPILLLVLLAETFIEVQITRSLTSALQMTVETLVLALISFLIMSTRGLQEWVLLNPEITVLLIPVIDILIGRYSGLRLLEMWRFRELLNK